MDKLPLTYCIAYVVIGLSYVGLCIDSIRRIVILFRTGLNKSTPSIVNYYYATAIATAMMAVRAAGNIGLPAPPIITFIRIISGVLVLYLLILGSRVLWEVCIAGNYILKGKQNDTNDI